MRKIWRWHWSLRKVGLSLKDILGEFEILRFVLVRKIWRWHGSLRKVRLLGRLFGEFEILRILFYFGKKDMEFGSVRKIGLVENN